MGSPEGPPRRSQITNYAPLRMSGGTSLSSTAWQFPYVQSAFRKHSIHEPSACFRQRIGGLLQPLTRATIAAVAGCESKSISNCFFFLAVPFFAFFAIALSLIACSARIADDQIYCLSAFLKPLVTPLVSCDEICVFSAMGIRKLPLCEVSSGPNVMIRSCFRSRLVVKSGSF